MKTWIKYVLLGCGLAIAFAISWYFISLIEVEWKACADFAAEAGYPLRCVR